MGAVNAKNGTLYVDFQYRGVRCKEYTKLPDTPANRNRLKKLVDRIEAEILLGCFDYAAYFPNSKKCKKFQLIDERERQRKAYFDAADSPKFAEFANIWLAEMKVEWSKSHYMDVEGVLNKYLLPTFGNKKISAINKGQILQFRSILAKVPGRSKGFLSPSRINHIMTPLRVILNEAADRYDFTSPWKNIKALKVGRTEVDPFNLDEVELFLSAVEPEFHCYYTTRFFTGMRTGEIDALMWKDVDLDSKTITVSQSYVRGEMKALKTDGSYRVIHLTERVIQSLRAHKGNNTSKGKDLVFKNSKGAILNYAVVSRSVWYPTLETCNHKRRNPYQTRHTFATLLLASGESPEWIANQLGHTTTTMLFRVYSHYVPNLTRRDGSAFANFLNNGGQL
ncbi:site-specific integrase [Vibrio fluminensis]|uniref:site-specific integrase n=1 Tax=Vibrio fluminensis TaxID=2783614 RepID=UPI0018894BF0|nr:site-specific integrase [Vibrio fluminensis]